MNTMQLSCLVEVAAQLSFSKAAEALHVSQPTVSNQIKALEDELGCALLVRSTRSVRLTDDGFAFLECANDILDLAARAERRLKHKQRPSSQQLRIGVHDGLEAQLIASTLKRMNAEAEGFDPVIRMAPMSALRSMLENGLVDVLLESRDPAGEPDAASVFRRPMECPAGLSLRKARSTYGPRILSGARSILCSARSILSAANRLLRTDCSTSPATICHHSVSRPTARRAWRKLSVD